MKQVMNCHKDNGLLNMIRTAFYGKFQTYYAI